MVGVLEAFERERRALTSAELIQMLDAPRSSVAALLRAMVDLSVLSLDRRSATYLPTAHFARLAAWLDEAIVREPRVLEMLKTVQEACSETVTLSAPTDLCMEILRVERGNLVISFIAEPGQQITFWGSAFGMGQGVDAANAGGAVCSEHMRQLGWQAGLARLQHHLAGEPLALPCDVQCMGRVVTRRLGSRERKYIVCTFGAWARRITPSQFHLAMVAILQPRRVGLACKFQGEAAAGFRMALPCIALAERIRALL